jgi:hypothetical protein
METEAQTISSTPRRKHWNKGKLIGQKPPLRPKHVVDPYPIANGRSDARFGNVHPGEIDRQQAAGLRCRRTSGRGLCTQRVCGRSRHNAAEEDRSAC